MRGGVKGRLELFWKFIRFGIAGHPLQWMLNCSQQPKSGVFFSGPDKCTRRGFKREKSLQGSPPCLSLCHFPAWRHIWAGSYFLIILPPLSAHDCNITPPPLKQAPSHLITGSKWGWARHCWKHCVKRSKVFRPKRKHGRMKKSFSEFISKSWSRPIKRC